MWGRIETELQNVKAENLEYDHPLCLGVLDITSEPFTNMPQLFCDDMHEKYIQDKEAKNSSDEFENLSNVEYGKWLDQPKKLQEITRQLLEALGEEDSVDTTKKESKLKRKLSILIIHQWTNFIGDVMELYAMHKGSGILKYCLIEQASIPLHITSPSGVYSLIHIPQSHVLYLRLHIILKKGDSDFSEEEGQTTTMTPESSPY
ncbi:20090_t:CDS:2 [Entrophospora sp. SA101]|nr:20090_t:CDS:2 [Entrophospora sp. SA101]